MANTALSLNKKQNSRPDIFAIAAENVKKENERRASLTAAGVKDIDAYDKAYEPLKDIDEGLKSLYAEIDYVGKQGNETQISNARKSADNMMKRIEGANKFLDTYGNLYDENAVSSMRNDLTEVGKGISAWLTESGAPDYAANIGKAPRIDTTTVAKAIRDKESEIAKAQRGGKDTAQITAELNAMYDNGGAYGQAAKRRNEYNANKALLEQKKAQLAQLINLAPSVNTKAWETSATFQQDPKTKEKADVISKEIKDLEDKVRVYEELYAPGDDAWLKVYGYGADLSAYNNITYGKGEDPIAYIRRTTAEPFNASSFESSLSADERTIYNYLLKNEGVEAARKWLNSGSVRDVINQRIGQAEGAFVNERFKSNLLKTIISSAYGFSGGVGNYINGLSAPVASSIDPSALSAPASLYANQEASKDLGFFGKAISDAAVSIGNMAPSIALGAVNPVLGQASFGVSAAGNAYNEARKEGKTVEQAALYGIVSGASEVFLQNALGSIPGISGASNKLATAAMNLKTPALRALAVYGIDEAGEATEEYLQEILDPMFRNAIFNEDNEIKIFTGEAAYSAMLGALTSVFLNSPKLARNITVGQLGNSIDQGGWYDSLIDNALKLDKDSNAYELASKLNSGELKANANNIGELLLTYKADGGDESLIYGKGTIEKMPNSTVTESVDNPKPVVEHNETLDKMIAEEMSEVSIISNKQAEEILANKELLEELGVTNDPNEKLVPKRNAVKEAVQRYHDAITAQDARKTVSDAQNETSTQTAGEASTEAQGEDADTFQYAHIVEKQKLGTRLLSELEGRTSKTGEKLADKLTEMATSITGDEDANRAVYKLFANPRYAAAASIEDGAGFLEIIRNFKTDGGKNFARKQMSGFINDAATAATITELLRKDVNVTLENAAGMKPAEGKNAPRGYYDETDHRVAIADNILTYETLVGTIAHEGFHANGAIDRALVDNFANTLKELWGENDWNTNVKLKKDSIEAYTGKPISTLKAEEEVCAQTLTELFNTQKAWSVMGEMFGKIEGSDRLLNRIMNALDRFFANFKRVFKGKMPAGKLTTFRENLEHLIKETKGDVKPAKESKTESKKEAKKATEVATDAELDAELEAELAEETEQTAKPEKNDAVGYKTKPTDSEAETPTETKNAPAEEDETVELVSDLYDAEVKGGRLYSVGETDENPALGLNSEDGDGIIDANTSKGGSRSYSYLYTDTDEFYRDVPYGDRENFMLHLAKATNNIPDGETRFVYVNGYIFEADGFMSGRVVGPYNAKNKNLLKGNKLVYGNIINDNKTAALWSKAVRDAGGGSSDNVGVPRKGRSGIDGRLSGVSSGSDTQGDFGRIRQTYASAEEIEKLVRELKEKFGATDEELASIEVKRDYSSTDTDITHPDIDSPSMRRDLTTLESAKDLDDGRMYSAEDTDIEETPFESVNEYRAELARIYRDGNAEGKSAEEIEREADEFTRVHNARLAAQFGTIKQGEKPAREVAIPKRTSKEEKVSQTPRTLEEALATPEEILPTIERMVANGTFSYEPMSNKKLVEKAKDKIGTTQDSFNDALKLWQRDGKLVAADQIVMGWVLYDEAVKKKEYATATEICVDMVARERTLGQGLQAARVLKMLTPAGQVKAAVRVANNLTDQLVKEGRLARKRFSDKDKDSVEKIRKFARRKGEEKVGDQLDKIGKGEQTETWANEVRSILAENISRRIKPLNQATMLTARGVANDLMAFAEKTLPKTAPRTAAERIRDFFANRKEYIKAWNEAKDVLKEKYKNDANSLKILEEFFNATAEDRADTVMMRAVAEVALNKDMDIRAMMQKVELGDVKSVIDKIYEKLQTVVNAEGSDAALLLSAVKRWVTEKHVATHPLTQRQIDAIIRKKLTQACGNINSIIRQNGKSKGEQLQRITAMLINEFGISNEAAVTAAEKIEERYNFVLDRASKIALANAVKERKPGEKKSLNELFEQYANMGAFTGDYNEAVAAKLFDREGIKVNPALAEAYLAATTEEGRIDALNAIYEDIGSQMPSTFADKFNAWRYLAMLGNLRTHIRNVLGNAFFAPVVLTKDLVATGIEQSLQAATKGKFEASKGFGVFKDGLWTAAVKDAKLMSDVIMSGQKYEDLVSANEAIKKGRVIFDKKWQKPFELLRKINSGALEFEDAMFSKPHYAFALAQYCSAKGITSEDVANGKIPDEARAYAIKEAQKATFRDLNWFSKKLSNLRVRGDNIKSKAVNIVIEGVIPFKKTPANILVRGVEYSPVGLAKGIYDFFAKVRKGEMSATEFIDEISAGLTGTGLMLFGMLCSSMGWVEGASDDDEKEREFNELTGHQSYALVFGNKTFTIDWLAPEALPFFVGVEISKHRENEGVFTMAGITDNMLDIMGPMLELSCLQSLNDVIDSVKYAKENEAPMVALTTAATSYFTQIFPTLLGQAERTGENKRMQTFTNKDSWLTSDVQYLLGKISAKIPIYEYQQIPYIDAWGRVKDTGPWWERAYNNFINPSYVSEIKVSAMEQELQRLYEATKGENNISIYPKRAEKHFTVKRKDPVTGKKESEDYYLSAEEYVQYATVKGNTAYETITAFMQGPIYNTLDDKEKAKAITSLYSYAEEYARTTVTDHEPEGLTKRAIEAAKQGMDFDTLFNAYVVQGSVEADKDFLGDTVENSASNKKIDAINKITSDLDERLLLYKELDVGKTAQNNEILDSAIDAKINGNTAEYDAAIKRYIDNNKGANEKSATAEYEKRIAEIREELVKLSYDDPAEYEKQLEYYRSGSVAKDFNTKHMNEAEDDWIESYTNSLARKLKKYRGDTEKEELIYAEAAKYGIKERELNKRADKLK